MDILAKIFEWIQKQPDWQSDAFRRIWETESGALSDDDISDLIALVKLSCGIPDDMNRNARPFLPLPKKRPTGAPPMRLCAIKDLANVNALASDQELSFNPDGLTIVYGMNGSGKSGYSRVIKRACYARAQGDMILSDAFRSDRMPASAKFVWQGREKPMLWEDGQEIAKDLGQAASSVAVFDSDCARIYTDKKSRAVDYQPYGLGFLRALADVCKNRLGTRLGDEARGARKTLEEASVVIIQCPMCRTFVQDIMGGKINDEKGVEKAQAFSNFTENEQQQLDALEKIFAEQDPQKRPQRMRESRDQINALKDKIILLAKDLDSISTCLPDAIRDMAAAEKMARLAAGQFELDDYLPGTGQEDAWKRMFCAAREFSAASYKDSSFPTDKANSRCVLCQQPLGDDAKERLKKFDDFMRDRAETVLSEKQESVKQLRENLIKLESALIHLLPSVLYSELRRISDEAGVDFSNLPESVKAFVGALQSRRETLIKSLDNIDYAFECGPGAPAPICELEKICNWIDGQIKYYDNMAANREKSVEKVEELRAKKAFSANRDAFINLIRLEWCRKEVLTRKITDFEKSISNEEVNKKLAERLNKEIKALGGPGAGKEISFKATHRDGQSMIQLSLHKLDAKYSPMQILSEGEQRAIALASFFAEVSVSEEVATLVFDDPVSSLDDGRMENVAKRLQCAAWNENKQVIVFTHDDRFVGLLGAGDTGGDVAKIGLWEHNGVFGVVGEIPFVGKSIPEQIDHLKKKIRELEEKEKDKKFSPDNMQTELESCYARLRDAIEHFTEREILNGAVVRHRAKVYVAKLPDAYNNAEKKRRIVNDINNLNSKLGDRHHKTVRKPPLRLDEFRDLVEEFVRLREEFKEHKK